MKFQLMSDLHTEFHAFPLKMLEKLTFEPDLDFLLLPGDIVVPCSKPFPKSKTTIRDIFEFLGSKARHVLYVTGNHEYYHGDKETVEALIEAALPSNFHWLRDTSVTIDGQHFFGGTMWFPYSSRNLMYEDGLSDFLVIKGFKKWVYASNSYFVEAAKNHIKRDTVVLTHHVPSYTAVAPVFQGDALNRFFVCNMDPVIGIAQPALWVYGHTHLPGDMMLGETRVVANPYGYPSERKNLGPYPPVVFEI